MSTGSCTYEVPSLSGQTQNLGRGGRRRTRLVADTAADRWLEEQRCVRRAGRYAASWGEGSGNRRLRTFTSLRVHHAELTFVRCTFGHAGARGAERGCRVVGDVDGLGPAAAEVEGY